MLKIKTGNMAETVQIPTGIQVERFSTNPLITPVSSPTLGDNINGSSVIRVPKWLLNPLGKYYMYFAHHADTYIRLAYADDLQGPWKVYEPGTLHLNNAEAFLGHIASPDVHVDEASQQFRMYFHGVAKAKLGQWTGVAYSKDSINFSAKPDLLGKFYFRVWQWQDHWYAIAKNHNEGWGELYRASHPDGPFELRGNFLKNMRHVAVVVDGHTLQIFYSRVGDAPERILMATVDMRGDWLTWQPTEPVGVLRQSEENEGIQYPFKPSSHGSSVSTQELRDPFVMVNKDEFVLFYTGMGEIGICGAISGGLCKICCSSCNPKFVK
jgi:hypothetical protein